MAGGSQEQPKIDATLLKSLITRFHEEHDSGAIAELVEHCKPWLEQRLLAKGLDSNLVQDVIQETWVKVMKCCAEDIKAADPGYLWTTVWHKCCDVFAKIRRERPLPPLIWSPDVGPSETIDLAEIILLKYEKRSSNPKHQEVIRLWCWPEQTVFPPPTGPRPSYEDSYMVVDGFLGNNMTRGHHLLVAKTTELSISQCYKILKRFREDIGGEIQ